MQILLIDDDNTVRDTLRATLAEAGHQVICARNGAEGLALLDRQAVQLVVTDILMPEKEGVETIIEIRKKQPDLPIIAISGGGQARNFTPLKIAHKVGADFVLPKPFESDELLNLVRQAAELDSKPTARRQGAL